MPLGRLSSLLWLDREEEIQPTLYDYADNGREHFNRVAAYVGMDTKLMDRGPFTGKQEVDFRDFLESL